MPNGKDYVLLYLKLLVESLTHEGHLRFSDTIPYNEQMISTITNTNVDIVRSAMKIFEQLHMVEILDDETIYMAEVKNMVGSETEWAKKKRLYRENQPMIEDKVRTPKDNVRQEIELEIEKELDKDIYKYIVEYLNQKSGSKFKYSSKATQRHISGRLSEGYSLEDFKIVIDKKVGEWKEDPKMAQYIRPETLFGTKFEGYLNQKEVKGNPQPTLKVNPKIHNYPQRTYTKEDYSDIEKKLLRRTMDADKT